MKNHRISTSIRTLIIVVGFFQSLWNVNESRDLVMATQPFIIRLRKDLSNSQPSKVLNISEVTDSISHENKGKTGVEDSTSKIIQELTTSSSLLTPKNTTRNDNLTENKTILRIVIETNTSSVEVPYDNKLFTSLNNHTLNTTEKVSDINTTIQKLSGASTIEDGEDLASLSSVANSSVEMDPHDNGDENEKLIGLATTPDITETTIKSIAPVSTAEEKFSSLGYEDTADPITINETENIDINVSTKGSVNVTSTNFNILEITNQAFSTDQTTIQPNNVTTYGTINILGLQKNPVAGVVIGGLVAASLLATLIIHLVKKSRLAKEKKRLLKLSTLLHDSDFED